MRRCSVWLCATALLAGCSGQVQIGDPENGPRCGTSVDEMPRHGSVSGLLLMAQSVPTASLVPCVHPLPVGWTFRRLEATDGGAHFWLTSDRHGETALRVDVAQGCRVGNAPQATSDKPRTELFERIEPLGSTYRGERFYRFAGGCITVRFDLGGSPSEDEASAVSDAVGTVSRDALRRYVHEYSDGRFELDAHPGGQR